ncbi:MAG: bifunctional (p)ppGpp synthetase/guanosine-3',5'-bis(diphosphate) 3'-pyrophosphohydrolase [Bacteroidetes bacterium]|uniref:Bifunctional (P)ppGpp synthetase/guanosine-3',5'-bis(Diphosphate) 3'-pyrophosphohydrolase n=1 Tax=Candidatus Merdivivens pullicola TaxID=2840872 RepID=A0A9D9NH29_9BACT|nr:bifunctional (p)ppGpp synthetase/guanosine-3',5'-bis(diphosphate) 3'-pyrophosphohydrolase [Candidatus Merdivivens pullicola]
MEDIFVEKAYKIAEKALEGMKRGNNAPFITHPVGVAKIVCDEIGMGKDCAAAVFLHEATRFRPEILESEDFLSFPQDIRNIAVSLNRISTIRPKDTRLEADTYRRLIISYSRDPRVTLIKLADRLEVMRNIRLLPKSSREMKVVESQMLYVPIAHQIGLYSLKGELEDIYLKYTEPAIYNSITNKLRLTAKDREEQMSRFIEPLKQRLSDAGISYQLKARTKTAYSIWRKMVKQDVPFEKVYDVYAIRFIIDCPPDRKTEHEMCWNVFSYVTSEYKYDTSRLRDWLSKPKPNGYESLHVTIEFEDKVPLEVQIRTRRMDIVAESGGASHWSYKGVRMEQYMQEWLASVRNVMSQQERFSYDNMPDNICNDVFVYTPSGELKQLRYGATLLDFAFAIHTNIGLKCSGGMVNGKRVSIREKLATGDVVEAVTNKNQRPNLGWLDIAVTSKARTKIRQKLAEDEFKKASEGKELMSRRLKNWKLELTDEDLGFLIKKYSLKSINEFYCAVAENKIDIFEIKSYLSGKDMPQELRHPSSRAVEDTPKEPSGNIKSDVLVIGGNINNIGYRMAKCCNPVYGDDVFGFISVKDGITIHRVSCPNAARLIERYPYRIQRVRWSGSSASTSFQVTLKVLCRGEKNLGAPVMEAVSQYKASVRSMVVNERNSRDVTHEIELKLSVPNNLELDKVISAVKKVKDVTNVLR